MKIKTVVIGGVSLFFIACAALVVDSALQHPQKARELMSRIVPLAGSVDEQGEQTATQANPTPQIPAISASPVVYPRLTAKNADERTITLGVTYDEIKRFDVADKYKLQVELTSRGAAIKTLSLSEFNNRDTKDPAPLELLSSFGGKQELLSLANTSLKVAPGNAEKFDTKSFPLDRLDWQLVESDVKDEVRFEAILADGNVVEGGISPVLLKIIKTYRIQAGSYDLECDIAMENLSANPIKVLMQLQGPGGMGREGVRQDGRKVKAAYRKDKDAFEVKQLDIPVMQKKIDKGDKEAFQLKNGDSESRPIWSALSNKYFAAIVYDDPAKEEGQPQLSFTRAQYYPAPTEQFLDRNLHNCSFSLASSIIELAAAGQDGAENTLSYKMYAGPKDKNIFENNETYKALQFFQTIDFRACCCPVSVIAPLAFGIMWLMNFLYMLMGPLGNYGIVIMILVFFVRLALHPITKKSQVSMMKMQKLGPKMQEIQKKYANNKQEMNKQMMAMYRESGSSPISGMLPMFLQMPIWIALWTAVYTSVDLRGEGFLPVWITDLSMPDQLFPIPFAIQLQGALDIKFFGFNLAGLIPSHFNLLPILMGVVMYIQQKMMPSSQPSAQTNPQMAQQQKMMMVMMPLMFPVILYSGPSGVNMYIMSSITAGVIEQKIIRKHIKEKEEQEALGKVPVTAKTGGKVKKKKPKPMFKDR